MVIPPPPPGHHHHVDFIRGAGLAVMDSGGLCIYELALGGRPPEASHVEEKAAEGLLLSERTLSAPSRGGASAGDLGCASVPLVSEEGGSHRGQRETKAARTTQKE